jgi:hypothetical protein
VTARSAQASPPGTLGDLGDLIPEESIDEPPLGAAWDDRDGVEQASCGDGQPARTGEHRLANRNGDLVAVGGEHFGDEKRIAAGQRVESLVRPAGTPCELFHRRLGEQWKRDATERVGWKLAEELVETMVRVELVVAVGDDEESTSLRDAPTGELEKVERGLIRPVNIFEHDGGWR